MLHFLVYNIRMGELEGKVAVITGAGSGMARATAKVFVQQQGGAKRCRRLRDAKVVMLELNSAEPLKAADCTVLPFLQSHYVYLRQKVLEMKRLRKEIEALRRVALLLAEIDEQSPEQSPSL